MTVYTIPDMLSLQVALVNYPEGWVGVSDCKRLGVQRAAQAPFCTACLTTSSVAYVRFRRGVGKNDTIVLFPTYADLCGVRYDMAAPKCVSCGGPKS